MAFVQREEREEGFGHTGIVTVCGVVVLTSA